jgi:hypothetical protein
MLTEIIPNDTESVTDIPFDNLFATVLDHLHTVKYVTEQLRTASSTSLYLG